MDKSRVKSVWKEYKLLQSGFGFRKKSSQLFDPLERASSLRLALSDLGGLFSAFGIFLAGRADLLPFPYQTELRKIGMTLLEDLDDETNRLLERRFPERKEVGNSIYSRIFRVDFHEKPVILEVYAVIGENFQVRHWNHFLKGIHLLKDTPESEIARESILNEFHKWLYLHSDVERRRRILGTLQSIPADSKSIFPEPVDELHSKKVLAYYELIGNSPGTGSESESFPLEDLRNLVDAILEQSLFLSVIPSQVALDNILNLPDGKLGYRIQPHFQPVSVNYHQAFIQYLVSACSGNMNQAAKMTVRLSRVLGFDLSEENLWRELSRLRVQQKEQLPESLALLRDIWKAQSRCGASSPFFLQLFQRNMMLLGQDQMQLAPREDLVLESIWPVLGRLIRFHTSEAMTMDGIREWFMGSGLFSLGLFRQIGNLMEQARENDFAVTVKNEQTPKKSKKNRVSVVLGVLLALVFVVTLQLSFQSQGSTEQLASNLGALISGISLMILIIRMR